MKFTDDPVTLPHKLNVNLLGALSSREGGNQENAPWHSRQLPTKYVSFREL